MLLGRKFVIAACVIFLLLPMRAAFAADDLQRVLHDLDVAATTFHSTTADFEFDSIQTDPVPDKDVQKGTVYYERAGNGFQMGIHIREINGKVVPKIITVSHGVFKLFEKMIDQVTTSTRVSKYEGYLELGFGASGKELSSKWNIRYLGSEAIDGVKTEKLELVAKDPDFVKTIPKVTIWVDPERAVSLKQEFDEGQGQSRTCRYFDIKVNQPLPADAFAFKTDSKTQFVNR